MTLPKIYVPAETVEIYGALFEVRVLTRAEAARFQKMVADGAPAAELEIAVIATATDTPVDATREWYEHTPTSAVQQLVEAIERVSRIDEGAHKSS